MIFVVRFLCRPSHYSISSCLLFKIQKKKNEMKNFYRILKHDYNF